ncbi:MAG: DUF4931 domain-containing protein [Candidatus Ozemobacteraceae bacterium]
MPEIRQNLLTGEWVIIAPERAKRPANLIRPVDKPVVPKISPTCPFCPGNEHLTTDERFRLCDDGSGWLIRSVVNRFSVLSVHDSARPENTTKIVSSKDEDSVKKTGLAQLVVKSCSKVEPPTDDLLAKRNLHGAQIHGELHENGVTREPPLFHNQVPGIGLHEVIIEHPRHDLTLALYTLTHIENLLAIYLHRFVEFAANPHIRHVILFKNHGEEAGASQQHPHSQIVGLPILPGQVFERVGRAHRFYRETGTCLACRMIEEECRENARLVEENEAFVAFIPFAALSPFHLWIFPKKHNACFSQNLMEELPLLAAILHRVLGRVFTALDNPAYNLVIRSLTPGESGSLSFHWYISLVPRVGKLAGFELGTGMFVNPSSSEVSAARLRQAPLPPVVPAS